jgi:hypothetical protein
MEAKEFLTANVDTKFDSSRLNRASPDAPAVLKPVPRKVLWSMGWVAWPRRQVNHWVVLNLTAFRQPCSGEPMASFAIGPHWPGVIFVAALLAGSTQYICSTWPWAAWAALLCCALCVVFLVLTSCTDPGFVTVSATAADEADELCYCEECQLCQPKKAYHCDSCGRCVDGWDHHCLWMGQCIGKGNVDHFWRFNASWLAYMGFLIYLTCKH